MKSVRIILSIFVCSVLASCSIQYAQYAVTSPPAIDISQTAVTVLLINRFDPNQLEFKKDKKTRIFKEASLAMLEQVRQEFASHPNLNVVAAFDSITMARDIHSMLDSSILSTEQVARLAKKYNADYILSMESYNAGFSQDEVEKVKNTDGSTNKTAYYSIFANSTWAWYKTASNTFTELKGNASQYHSKRAVLSGLLAFGPAIVSNEKEIKQVSGLAVASLLANYKGETRHVQREIYSGKPFKQAAKDIQTGDYDSAREALKPLAKSDDADIASKAYYNLAVLSQVQGNETAARDFAKLSLEKKENMLAKLMLGMRSPLLDIISQAR